MGLVCYTMQMHIIAEVKTHSPFGWASTKSWDELFEVAEKIGDIISVHTDPRWHGSFDLIREARRRTSKPILAKGIHATDEEIQRAIDAGASYVLVVGRVPHVHLERCLIEPHSLEELSKIPAELKAVWNSRDLNTGGMKTETFAEARKVFTGWLCQASNISNKSDIDMSADAVLIGTNLMRFKDGVSI
jgi:indole-3-glycerol phosphate synthase